LTEFKKTTYCDQIVDFIKSKLLNGELSPGDPIREVTIASELSISRAPVREAMQVLLREGLIEAHPQKVKRITALTSKQIKNSYFTGGVLEAAAVAVSINRYTKTEIAALNKVLSKMKKVADTNGLISDLVPLDNDFHDILFSKIDNDLIVELCWRSCQGISKFLLYKHWKKLFSTEQVYERHKKIIEALNTKDPYLIESTLREHYFESGEKMSKYGVDIMGK